MFTALSRGGGGLSAAQTLRTIQRSKHLLLILGALDAARRSGHRHVRAAEQAYDGLAAIQKRAPEAVDALIRYPAVGAWARRTAQDLPKEDAPSPARLGAVTAAAAIRGRLPCEVWVPVDEGRVVLPSLGALTVDADDDLVPLQVDGSGQVTVAGRAAPIGRWHLDERMARTDGWRGLRRLTADEGGRRLSVLVDDLDPYRWPGSTADQDSEHHSLREHVQRAWGILVAGHWTTANEIASIVIALTPLQARERAQNSASSRDLFGTIALSPPQDGLGLAETLSHEIQHAKLSALLDVVRLTRPDDGQRHYAPWREDPRPIHGLLHGAYAYLGVSGFWRRQRSLPSSEEDRFAAETRFARWRAAAYEVTGTLVASGLLTGEGERFVAGMRSTLEPWLAEPVTTEAEAAARQESRLHRDRSLTTAAGRSPDRPGGW
ncbi:HEXXH motif domain-containing protein [Nonomuraea sp. NPDC002799]